MTVFRKSVSWSKFRLALSCPLRLQKTIDKEYSPKFGVTSPAAAMGKLVQKVFELYFNGDFNLKEGGQRITVLVKILDKVINSPWAVTEGVDPSFKDDAVNQLAVGLATFHDMGILNRQIRSEVKMQVTYAGLRMFGMLDFLINKGNGFSLYDGKGNVSEDADVMQLKYYALMVNSSSGKEVDGGFIYWKHGFRSVDLSSKALYEFTHAEFSEGRKVFDKLKAGVDKLEAKPSSSSCNFCLWKNNCSESYYQKQSGPVIPGIQEVGF